MEETIWIIYGVIFILSWFSVFVYKVYYDDIYDAEDFFIVGGVGLIISMAWPVVLVGYILYLLAVACVAICGSAWNCCFKKSATA